MDKNTSKKIDDFKDYFCRKCNLRNVEIKRINVYTEYDSYCTTCPVEQFAEQLKYEV
jgi:hypothetical protein